MSDSPAFPAHELLGEVETYDRNVSGIRRDIPHLWAYFLLDQILPVSFTQNLFLLTSVLQRDKEGTSAGKMCPPQVSLQIMVVGAYFALLSTAPSSVGTPWFFPMLLSTRAMLFAPFLLLRTDRLRTEQHSASSGQGHTILASLRIRRLLEHESRWALALIAAYFVLQLSSGLFTSTHYSTMAVWSALHDSSAISSLGYDLLIGGFSLVVCELVQ